MRRCVTMLATMLAELLEPQEREAVLGDLAESGASTGATVTQLLGLVMRRYLSEWNHVGPWLAVAGIAIPIGVVVSYISRWWAEGAWAQVSMYVTVWFPGYFDFPGARRDVFQLAWRTLAESGALVAWSWSAGAALVRLSRRYAWASAALFAAAVFAATSGTSTTIARHTTPDALFREAGVVAVVRLVLVVGPLLLAISSGHRRKGMTVAIIMAAGVAVLTWSTVVGIETAFTFGRGVIPLAGPDGIVGTSDDVRLFVPWIALLLLWPGGYVSALEFRHWRRSRG